MPYLSSVRHWLRRIADVFIVVRRRVTLNRQGERQVVLLVQIQISCFCVFRGPAVKESPGVIACLKDHSLRQIGLTLVFQGVVEERNNDAVDVELPRCRAPLDISQRVAIIVAPFPMRPGAHHEPVLVLGIQVVDCGVKVKCAVKVLGIVPPADNKRGGFDILHVRQDVAGFPEAVPRAVIHDIVPERDTVLEVLCVRVGERSEVEEELVSINRSVIERTGIMLGRCRSRPAKTGIEIEGVR